MKNLLFILLMFASVCLNAQGVAISPGNNSPDPSAMLDVQSTSKGLLPPRMNTQQMNAISSPAAGLMIYNTDCNALEIWNGGGWVAIGSMGSIGTPGSITGSSTPCQNATGVSYSVATVTSATGYNWTVPAGATVATGQGSNSITVNFGTSNGNVCVTASNACATGTASCTAITLNTGPATPASGTNTPSNTQIVWNWNTVSGATGYKYNTVNDYSSATDNGTSTSFTQTGLTCNTPYTLYVWAYGTCGQSLSATLTQTTSQCCSDGSGGTITHYTDGNNIQWTVHTFTSSGTFTPVCGGNVSVLAVGGGAGGFDYQGSDFGGGGGGGAVIYNSSYTVSGAVTVTVGGGGAQGNGGAGASGSSSIFGTITATGGSPGTDIMGGTSGNGNAGGGGTGCPGANVGGGGGGAGGIGATGVCGTGSGNGGPGVSSSITGTNTYYGGGGAAGAQNYPQGSYGGSGGIGGGGDGFGSGNHLATNGTPNTGGGGGGSCISPQNGGIAPGPAGDGGSGVVIVSYPTP